MSLERAEQIYLDVVESLQSDAESHVTALTEGEFGTDTPDVFKVEKIDTDEDIADGFDRSAINDKFKRLAAQNDFSVAKKLSLAYQTEIVCVFHKAAILRCRPRIKSLVVGALRDAGQTTTHGYIKFAMQQLPLTGQAQGGSSD